MIMQGKLQSKQVSTRNLIPETWSPKPEIRNPETGTSLCGITNLVGPGSFPLES